MRPAFLQYSLFALVVATAAGCRSTDAPQYFKHRPHTYQRVVSLSPSTSELLISAIQLPTQFFVGRTSADDYPTPTIKGISIVASDKPDYEKLTKIRPDLIVYDSTLYNAQDLAKLKSLGADMYSFKADTWPEYRKEVYELGSLLAGESHVSDYLDRVNVEINNAGGKTGASRKVAVVMPDPSGSDYIVGTDSFLADIVKRCGGTPVGPKGDRFVKLSPEEFIQENPDVVITSAPHKDAASTAAFLRDPRFQSVSAIKYSLANPKSPHVVPIDEDILVRKGCRVDELVRAIYRAVAG